MSLPIVTTYYFGASAATGTTFGNLTTTAPSNTITATVWNVGRNNPPLFGEMNYGATVLRTSTQWQPTPTASIPNQNAGGSGVGNSFLYNSVLNGEFLAGNWIISGSIRGTVQTATRTGRFIYNLWKAKSNTGAGAEKINTSYISSSIATINNITTPIVTTASVSLPNIIFRNEYLFLQIYWAILTSPGGGAANNNTANGIYIGTNFSNIIPTSFVQKRTTLILPDIGDFY